MTRFYNGEIAGVTTNALTTSRPPFAAQSRLPDNARLSALLHGLPCRFAPFPIPFLPSTA